MAPVQSSSKAKLVLIFLAITALMSSSVPAAAAFTPQDFILKHLNLGRRFLQSYYNPPGGYGPPGAGGGYPCFLFQGQVDSNFLSHHGPHVIFLRHGRRYSSGLHSQTFESRTAAVVVLERASSIQNIELCCPLPSRAKEWEQ
ncbi:hypothetical protein V6N13_054701 [Hibiscus sabdariffa]